MKVFESAKALVLARTQSLKEAELARDLVSELPAEIQQLEGFADVTGDVFTVTHYGGGSQAERAWAFAGAKLRKPTLLEASGDFYRIGQLLLSNGRMVYIYISGVERPAGCEVEQYRETVTRYKAVCPEPVRQE